MVWPDRSASLLAFAGSLIASAEKTVEVVPVKPDQKGEKPDNERSEDEEEKCFQANFFFFFSS